MFASRKFRDVFAFLNTGILPGIVAAGSSVTSVINMTGMKKVVYELYGGSGVGSAQLVLYGASTSAGAGSVAIGSTSLLFASATSVSGGVVVADVRGEYLGDRSAGQYLFAVASVSGGSMNVALTAKGYLCNYGPALNYDAPATFVKAENLLY